MRLPTKIFLLAGLAILATGAAYFYFRRQTTDLHLEAFRALPADFALAWQVDVTALRKSLLPLPKNLRGLDRVSGVFMPDRQTVVVAEGQLDSASVNLVRLDSSRLLYSSNPKLLAAAQDRWRSNGPSANPQGVPKDAAFWMVGNPGSLGPVRIGPIAGTTIELPGELSQAGHLVVAGRVGTLNLELEAQADYPDTESASRAASAFRGFLGLMRNLTILRKRADQVWKVFWESATVQAEGKRVLLRGKLDQAALARLLPSLLP